MTQQVVATNKRREAALRGWETRRRNSSRPTINLDKEGFPVSMCKPRFGNYDQIYDSGLMFTFYNARGKFSSGFFSCKDFLHCLVWANVNKSSFKNLYKMNYEYKASTQLDLENTRLALTEATPYYYSTTDKDPFKKRVENSIAFLNEIEELLGFRKTTHKMRTLSTWGENDPVEVALLLGDRRWMSSSVLISAYGYAIRLGLTYKKGTEGGALAHLQSGDFERRTDRTAVRVIISYFRKANFLPFLKRRVEEKNILDLFPSSIEENYPEEALKLGTEAPYFHSCAGLQTYAACLANVAPGAGSESVTKLHQLWKERKGA